MIGRTIKNTNGSALVMSLIGSVLLAISVYAALEITEYLNVDGQRARTQDQVAAFTQSIRTLASNPLICRDGIDGAGGQPGLRFTAEAGNALTTMDLTRAMSADGQKVHFGANITSGANPPAGIFSGDNLNDFSLTVNRLFIRVPAGAPAFPTTYSAQLWARLTSTNGITGQALRERLVTAIRMDVDGTGNITNCVAEESNLTPESMCASMGCNYDPLLAGQKCICPLPTASCPSGQYIKGLIPPDLTPNCADVSLSCPAGRFLAGVKADGSAACADVTPPAAPVPPPVICHLWEQRTGPPCDTLTTAWAPTDTTCGGRLGNASSCGGLFPCRPIDSGSSASEIAECGLQGYGPPPPPPTCIADGTLSGGDHVFANNSYDFTVWSGSGMSEQTNQCCSNTGWSRSPSCPGMNCAAIDVAVTCGPAPGAIISGCGCASCPMGVETLAGTERFCIIPPGNIGNWSASPPTAALASEPTAGPNSISNAGAFGQPNTGAYCWFSGSNLSPARDRCWVVFPP